MAIDNLARLHSFCRGKNWILRLPLLIYFVFIFFRHLTDSQYNSLLGGLNLGVHEFGHLLFSPCGEFFSVAGGTITQLLVPVYGMWNFYRQEDLFSVALCFGWLSTNFFNIAVYAADARSMMLPLVSPFGFEGSVIHDWNYLLSKANWLASDMVVAGFFKALAIASMLVCFMAGAYILWLMATLKKSESID